MPGVSRFPGANGCAGRWIDTGLSPSVLWQRPSPPGSCLDNTPADRLNFVSHEMLWVRAEAGFRGGDRLRRRAEGMNEDPPKKRRGRPPEGERA